MGRKSWPCRGASSCATSCSITGISTAGSSASICACSTLPYPQAGDPAPTSQRSGHAPRLLPNRPDQSKELAMCPECYATIALLVTGVVSTGGVTAAALKIFRHKKLAATSSQVSGSQEKEK